MRFFREAWNIGRSAATFRRTLQTEIIPTKELENWLSPIYWVTEIGAAPREIVGVEDIGIILQRLGKDKIKERRMTKLSANDVWGWFKVTEEEIRGQNTVKDEGFVDWHSLQRGKQWELLVQRRGGEPGVMVHLRRLPEGQTWY